MHDSRPIDYRVARGSHVLHSIKLHIGYVWCESRYPFVVLKLWNA